MGPGNRREDMASRMLSGRMAIWALNTGRQHRKIYRKLLAAVVYRRAHPGTSLRRRVNARTTLKNTLLLPRHHINNSDSTHRLIRTRMLHTPIPLLGTSPTILQRTNRLTLRGMGLRRTFSARPVLRRPTHRLPRRHCRTAFLNNKYPLRRHRGDQIIRMEVVRQCRMRPVRPKLPTAIRCNLLL